MKKYKTKDLVIQNILLLIPLILYGIYKNGYLIYSKNLISFISIFKPIYLVLISVIIKLTIDLIRYKKIKIDYNLIYAILIGMIMPYNINIFIYLISFTCLYIFTLFIEKYLKFNKVCFIYLIIILINFMFKDFTFMSIIEQNYSYSFGFLDLLIGRSVGGISSTSILFSLIGYIILINNYYYKKDIPLIINLTYLFLASIYFIFTNNSEFLLNSDLIFASIFISTLPEYSPYKQKSQIIYSIIIGILAFVVAVFFNGIISIYLVTFLVSLLLNIKLRQKKTKLPIA